MTKAVTDFIKALKTSQLVELFNLAQSPKTWKGQGKPGATVQKFADRATAEKRIIKLMLTWDDAPNAFAGYNEFYGDFAGAAHRLEIEMPTPEDEQTKPKPKPQPKPGRTIIKGPDDGLTAAGKKKTVPHLNLRCAFRDCGYYAKTTPEWLQRGRLTCPMDKTHGPLLTAEERGEKRGRP